MKRKGLLSVLLALTLTFTFTYFSLIAFADTSSDNQITPTGSSGYSVVSGSTVGLSGDFLTGVVRGSTVATLKENISDSVTAYSASGAMLSDNTLVGTGCYIVLYQNSVEVDRVIVVVWGDTNGDGYVRTYDAKRILRDIVGSDNLENEYYLAADTNSNAGTLSTYDAKLILKAIAAT